MSTNITCPACNHRHPDEWDCEEARDRARQAQVRVRQWEMGRQEAHLRQLEQAYEQALADVDRIFGVPNAGLAILTLIGTSNILKEARDNIRTTGRL